MPLYQDEMQLIGWRWLCPGCQKQVKTIYYPIEVRTLCYYLGFDPGGTGTLARHPYNEADRPQRPLSTFACFNCHRIQSFFNTDHSGWNLLVSHLSAGLLFGHEVTPPTWFKLGDSRKRTRTRQLTRPAPRREAVLRRLLNGWSNRRIARDLNMSIWAVDNHIRILCRQEDVPDRHALAAKLGASNSPPLNQEERAAKRRFQVKELLLSGLSRRQIMAQLDTSLDVLARDIHCLYRLHGVGGHGQQARRALAAKLGVKFPPTHGDCLRQRISQLQESGLTPHQIAHQLHLSPKTIYAQLKKIRRASELENPKSPSTIAPATPPSPAPTAAG